MDTQNTPVHIKLWHKDFWSMAVAGLLLSASMYMLVPVMPGWLMGQCGLSAAQTAVVMGLPGVGVFVLGGLTSHLVQRYQRDKVCLRAILLLMLSFAAVYYLNGRRDSVNMFWALCALRLFQGAVYGEARMVLGSTLIIDTCESFQRTGANHAAGWFSRFGLALGPAAALLLMPLGGLNMVLAAAAGMCAAAVLLIVSVRFPFKAPDDVLCKLSTDRFWLSGGWGVALNLLPVAVVAGLVIVSGQGLRFYSMMTCGFLLALLAQRFLFVSAAPKSEIVSGLILVFASLLILHSGHTAASPDMAATLFGCGTGLACARFLLHMIKLSDHCKRGTAQSTFMLTCEFGLSAGVSLGCGVFSAARDGLLLTALCLTAAALVMYAAFTHSWFLRHKHR